MNTSRSVRLNYILFVMCLITISNFKICSSTKIKQIIQSSNTTSLNNTISTTFEKEKENEVKTPIKTVLVNECTLLNCHEPYGKCIGTNVKSCVCNKEYYNYKDVKITKAEMLDNNIKIEENSFCQYKKKKMSIALMLEIFFPIGAGHFYIKKYLVGTFKFMSVVAIPFLFLLSALLLPVPQTNSKAKSARYAKIFLYFYILLLFTWYCVDILMFLNGVYKDENGVELV